MLHMVTSAASVLQPVQMHTWDYKGFSPHPGTDTTLLVEMLKRDCAGKIRLAPRTASSPQAAKASAFVQFFIEFFFAYFICTNQNTC